MDVVIATLARAKAWTPPIDFVDRLAGEFPQHTFVCASDYDTLRRCLLRADVAMTPIIDRDIYSSLTRLRWIQLPAAGVSHVIYPELVHSRVVITNARGIRAHAIAEYVIGVAIALSRRLAVAIIAQTRHEWAQDAIESDAGVRTLRGRRLAVIGFGAVGSAVGQLAAAFGFSVSAVRRRSQQAIPEGIEVYDLGRLDDVLRESDVVVLAVPLTPATHMLISDREIAVMKRGAYIINVGRGEILDESALLRGLQSGQIGGAAMDVFAREPLDARSPVWDLPNVIVTPHVAGAIEDYWQLLRELFAENLRRFESGRELLNVVDKSAGY
jgi:phosphoglycerate dehydrogenase-like enzyme